MRRMSDVEMEYYLKQVDRRGKALSLPPAEVKKWQDEFNKITLYLNSEYKCFIVSKIVRRERYANLLVFQEFVAKEENGLIASAVKFLYQGDAEKLDWICWLMHLKYMLMYEEQKKQRGLR